GRPPVEGTAEGDELLLSGGERRQLEGILIGFRTGVAKEEPVVGIAGELAEQFGQVFLRPVNYRVGVEADAVELVAQPRDIMRMRMADGDHGMATVCVEPGLAGLVPERAAAGLDDIDRKKGIYIEQLHDQ